MAELGCSVTVQISSLVLALRFPSSLERSAEEVGDHHLSVPDQPNERVQHEALKGQPPVAEDGVVHAHEDLGNVGVRSVWPFGPVEFDESHLGDRRKD